MGETFPEPNYFVLPNHQSAVACICTNWGNKPDSCSVNWKDRPTFFFLWEVSWTGKLEISFGSLFFFAWLAMLFVVQRVQFSSNIPVTLATPPISPLLFVLFIGSTFEAQLAESGTTPGGWDATYIQTWPSLRRENTSIHMFDQYESSIHTNAGTQATINTQGHPNTMRHNAMHVRTQRNTSQLLCNDILCNDIWGCGCAARLGLACRWGVLGIVTAL